MKIKVSDFVRIMVVLFLFLFDVIPALAEAPDLAKIIDEIDKLYRSETSYSSMEMTIDNPNWTRTLKLEAWTEGMEKTFFHILSPKKDKGIATLRIGNEMWNYFPKINKVMKVPPSMMMGSWMGSDFTNDDIVKESTFLEDYDRRLLTAEGKAPDYHYIELRPKESTVTVWGKIEIKVRKDTYTPVQIDYFDEKGRKIRIQTFSDIKDFNGRKLPSRMDMIPFNKKGRKTTIRYLEADFDKELPFDTFSLSNLKRIR